MPRFRGSSWFNLPRKRTVQIPCFFLFLCQECCRFRLPRKRAVQMPWSLVTVPWSYEKYMPRTDFGPVDPHARGRIPRLRISYVYLPLIFKHILQIQYDFKTIRTTFTSTRCWNMLEAHVLYYIVFYMIPGIMYWLIGMNMTWRAAGFSLFSWLHVPVFWVGQLLFGF